MDRRGCARFVDELDALADRVTVVSAGRIEQVDDAETIDARHRTGFVARFMGFDNMFALEATRLPGAGGGTLPARALRHAAGDEVDFDLPFDSAARLEQA